MHHKNKCQSRCWRHWWKVFLHNFWTICCQKKRICCHSGADFMFKLPEKTERQSSIKFDCEEGSEWKRKEATQWWDPGRLNLGSPEEIAYNWFLQSVSVNSSFLGLTSDIEITEHTQHDNAIVTTGPATQYQATKKPWSCTANVKELAKW